MNRRSYCASPVGGFLVAVSLVIPGVSSARQQRTAAQEQTSAQTQQSGTQTAQADSTKTAQTGATQSATQTATAGSTQPLKTGAAQSAVTASAAPAIPSYPDSPKGLEELMKKMLELKKSGDDKDLAPYVESLKLPDPDAFFRATFGDDVGNEMADAYQRIGIELPLSFPNTLAQLLAQRKDHPQAIRFTDSCNPNATETEYPILLLRTNSQPLYDVRFYSGSSMSFIPYFAYVTGAFRYLGNFKRPATRFKNAITPTRSPVIRVGGNVQAANLMKKVVPEYPMEAKQNHVQGTVLLHALIGVDGDVYDLQVLQGGCWLAQAAVQAVRQWRYRPTTVNGKPMAVDTTISVIFHLER